MGQVSHDRPRPWAKSNTVNLAHGRGRLRRSRNRPSNRFFYTSFAMRDWVILVLRWTTMVWGWMIARLLHDSNCIALLISFAIYLIFNLFFRYTKHLYPLRVIEKTHWSFVRQSTNGWPMLMEIFSVKKTFNESAFFKLVTLLTGFLWPLRSIF